MQTKLLAEYVADIRYDRLSERVRETAKKTVLDALGCAIAGAQTREGAIWREYFLAQTTSGPRANTWQRGFEGAGYKQAAALNAAFGHILDFDDVHNKAIAHLGVITVPAALAVAQARALGGRALIEALTAGFEIGARVGYAINPGSYRIWHTTAVVGALSSCAAVGKLMKLDSDVLLNAFGSAGTQAAGLWEFMEDGAMSKPLHTANATLCGIRSAELASLGLTGASRILEGDKGLLRALDTQYRPELLVEDLGGEYMLAGNSFKLYPCCRHIHSAIYSLEKLLKAHPTSPAHIVAINDFTYTAAKNLTDRPDPATEYACKFSMQYCLAAVAFAGGYYEGMFEPSSINKPEIRELMKKVTVSQDEAINAGIKRDSTCWANRIEVVLDSGETLAESTDYPPGDSHINPTWEELLNKFHALTDGVIGEERAARLAQRISALDEAADVNTLFD